MKQPIYSKSVEEEFRNALMIPPNRYKLYLKKPKNPFVYHN
ncbi:hypothetical protein [Fischerella thermalis]|nr:hypothetical protein [Fischerella thermalis]